MSRPSLPRFPVEGGCACGEVRYRLNAAPLCIYTCHCTDCQTLSTSVFSLNAVVRIPDLEILRGELKTWIRIPPSGNRIPQHVCAACGVRIFTEPAGEGVTTLTLRCGSLDDTSWLYPAAAIWMKSAQPWVRMPEETLLYDEAADFRPIVARWREIMGL